MPRKRRTEAYSVQSDDPLYNLQHSFRYFLTAIWQQLGLPPPTRAQQAIADYLQYGPRRLQIQGFRGVGKSWITGAFVLWTLFNDPEKKIMIVSASKERSDNMSIFLQKLIIETPWLLHLRPKDDNARWSRVSFDVNCSPHQAPSVKSVGITGQLTGSRADLIIADDVEVPSNSMTEMMREKLLQLVTEFESILTPKDTSRILYLGTPQTIFTIYRTLAQRGYRPMVWPARYPRDMTRYEGLLAPELQEDIDRGAKEWEPTDPDRFDEEDLLARESRMGRSNFMLQFMLDTSLSDAEKFPLKFADLIVTSVNPTHAPDNIIWCSDPRNILKELPCVGLPGDRFYSPMQIQGEWTPYTETICFVDPSGRGSDETAAAFLSQKNGFLYLHEIYASKDGYSDSTLLDILRRCKKYNAHKIIVESNFGDGIVAELFKKHIQQSKLSIAVDEERANVRKEDRIIDALEPVMNQHRLVIDQQIVQWDFESNPDAAPEDRMTYMLFYQMSRMCREKGAVKHDDRLDALAGAVKYYTDCLSISAYETVKARRQEDFIDLLETWSTDPEAAVNAMAFGMTLEQRQRARGLSGRGNGTPKWVKVR